MIRLKLYYRISNKKNLNFQVSSQSTNFIKEDSDTIITLANTTNGQTVGERNEFWTWVAGIAGFTTTEKPVVLDPPERCEPCC